jgi:hypothetical protein
VISFGPSTQISPIFVLSGSTCGQNFGADLARDFEQGRLARTHPVFEGAEFEAPRRPMVEVIAGEGGAAGEEEPVLPG